MQRRMWLAGVLLVLAGLAIALVPFALPAVDRDLGTGTAGAWEWTTDRGVRQVAGGTAVAIGGLLVLGKRRWIAVIGSLLAAGGGAWVAVAPAVLGEVGGTAPAETAEIVRALAHTAGAGGLVLLAAGFMLGRLWQHWRFERTPVPLPSVQGWQEAPGTQAGREPVARGPW